MSCSGSLWFPLGSSSTHWKKGHNRLQHLKNNLPGFFLNGTWSWPKGWRSDISSCPGVDGSSTRGVDVWLSLSNLPHCLNRNSRNNLWRDTWSTPSDPTGCRFLLFLKLGQDGRDREKGWVWRVLKDSYRVLLLVSAWRETLGIHLGRILEECLWGRKGRLVTIFSLQGISYMFWYWHASRRERSVLVLIFQDFFLSFLFQGKGGDPQRVVVFVG